jgi:hypothetical protein
MISIYKPYLNKIAEEHFKAIEEFINRSRTKMIKSELSSWLNTHIGISFKDLIIAKPKHLEQIKL